MENPKDEMCRKMWERWQADIEADREWQRSLARLMGYIFAAPVLGAVILLLVLSHARG